MNDTEIILAMYGAIAVAALVFAVAIAPVGESEKVLISKKELAKLRETVERLTNAAQNLVTAAKLSSSDEFSAALAGLTGELKEAKG